MNNYIDIYSRYHDKVVTQERPVASNNGYIYTAYAVKLGLPVDQVALQDCFDSCLRKGKFVHRSPNRYTPYVSRDEILGAAYLGLLKPKHMNGWDYSPFPAVEFSAMKLVEQAKILYEHKEDRNYFWRNNLDQIYRFAFSVSVVDRHFLLKTWGTFQWYNPIHQFYAGVAKLDSMSKPKPRNGVKFLKYGEGKAEMAQEFPADHPITLQVNNALK